VTERGGGVSKEGIMMKASTKNTVGNRN